MTGHKDDETRKSFVGKLRVLREVNTKLYSVELWLLNNIRNRNGWLYENLEEHLSEVEDIPILTAYIHGGRTVGDGHNYDLRRDKDGREYVSFTAPDAERIVGWIPKDANIRIEQDENSVPWIVANGYLWRWYAPELVDKIAGQGGMDVSIETLIHQERKEGDTEIEERYTILGVTVLGDGVMPAVAGASIKSLAELRDSMKQEILKAASYLEDADTEAQDTPKNNEERKRRTMIPTDRQLADAGKNFPGFTCVGLSEDGMRVALLSADHAPYAYSYEESDMGNVVEERIKAASAVVVFRADAEETEAALDTVMAPALNALEETRKANETLEAENKTLREKIEVMTARENARRLQAAKDIAVAFLEKRNADRDEECKFDREILCGLLSRIEAGEFTGLEDSEGCWRGQEAVIKEVKALCDDEQAKQDAANKAKERHYHSWSVSGVKPNAANMTMGEKLRSMGAND